MANAHHTCIFSHLILSGRCSCQLSAKDCFAEKEFGACQDQAASQQCQALYEQLKHNSQFALKTFDQNNLSVGQQSKIKMGGLLALQTLLKGESQESIDNIHELVGIIEHRYGGFDQLPFSQLMPKIAHFKFRVKP